jgi:hypothetical protein
MISNSFQGDEDHDRRLYKMNLKIRSYRAVKSDYESGVLECPNHPMKNLTIGTTRSKHLKMPDNYINLFKIERKFI